jgi:hypothetical protein
LDDALQLRHVALVAERHGSGHCCAGAGAERQHEHVVAALCS